MPIARSVFRGRHTGSPPAAGYSTTFPLTENPMVEGGGWVQGLATGLDWQNVKTLSGRACASALVGGAHLDDSVAVRTGINATKHFCQATMFIQGGYSPVNGHECELICGGTIGANSARLYESLFSLTGSFQFARWDGPIDAAGDIGGSFLNGGPIAVTNGQVCRVEYDATSGTPTLVMYQAGVARMTVTDSSGSKIVSGQPGLAFFVRTGTGADTDAMGWDDWSCGTY